MCAFVNGLDNRNSNVLGQGAPVSLMEQQIFYIPTSNITNYDPYATDSDWVRVKGAELKTSEKTNTTPFYDQYDEVGLKQGRVESTFELTQDYYGLSENILQLKNQELWFAEGLQDDRVLKDANGKPIFQEINFYRAKMVDFTMDKGDVFKVTGAGKYNTQTTFTVMKGITPVNIVLDGSDSTTGGSNYMLTINATDLYGATVDLSDLTDVELAGEITAINIVKTVGTPTIASQTGTGNTKTLTFTGTGSVTIQANVVTKNGGTFSATKTINIT